MNFLEKSEYEENKKIKVGDTVYWVDRSYSCKITPTGTDESPYFVNRTHPEVRVLITEAVLPAKGDKDCPEAKQNDTLVYHIGSGEYVCTKMRFLSRK